VVLFLFLVLSVMGCLGSVFGVLGVLVKGFFFDVNLCL